MSVRTPGRARAVEAAEAALDCRFAADLREWLILVGAADIGTNPVYGLSAEIPPGIDLVQMHDTFAEIERDLDAPYNLPLLDALPQSATVHLPIVPFGNGDEYCVVQPRTGIEHGPVLLWDHELDEWNYIAPGIERFVRAILATRKTLLPIKAV